MSAGRGWKRFVRVVLSVVALLCVALVLVVVGRHWWLARQREAFRLEDEARPPVASRRLVPELPAAPTLPNCVSGVVLDGEKGASGVQVSVSAPWPPDSSSACFNPECLFDNVPEGGQLVEAVLGATTDAHGVFSVCGLEGQGKRLLWGEAADGRLAVIPSSDWSVTERNLVTPGKAVVLRMASLGVVAGFVRDELGEPEPGAEVLVSALPKGYPATIGRLRRVRSDGRGRFSAPIPVGWAAEVHARAPGFGIGTTSDSLWPLAPQVLVLPSPKRVEVEVRHEGRPVAGAEVRVSHYREAQTTGPDGVATFAPVFQLVLRSVRAEATLGPLRGKVEGVVHGPLVRLSVTLAESAWLSGTVVDERGDPVEGARVWVNQEATTDARGEFRVGPLSLTPQLLRPVHVTKDGCARAEPGKVALRSGDHRQQFTMRCTPTLAGVVVDALDAGVEGAEITLMGLAGSQEASPFPAAVDKVSTNREGAFVSFAPPNHYELEVDHPHYRQPPTAVVRLPALGYRVVLDAGASLSGTVTDAMGRPVPFAKLVILTDGVKSFRQASSDERGRFLLEGLPAGRSAVCATHGVHGAALSEPLWLRRGEHVGGVSVRFELQKSVTGVVVDERGRPQVGQVVDTWVDSYAEFLGDTFQAMVRGPSGVCTMLAKVDPYRRTVTTNEEGAFELSLLGADEVGLRVASTKVRAKPGDRLRLVVKRQAARAAGRVVDCRSGAPLAEFDIDGDHAIASDGRFLVSVGTTPVRREVRISAPTYGAVTRAVESTQGDVELGDIALCPGAELAVVVESEGGRPLKQAEVTARQEGLEERSCQTDGQGRCVVDELRPGPVSVTGRAEGHVSREVVHQAVAGTTELRLTLSKASASVRGMVRAPASPRQGLVVALVGFSSRAEVRHAQCDENGSFAFPDVSAGRYLLAVELGRVTYWRTLVVSEGETRAELGPDAGGGVLELRHHNSLLGVRLVFGSVTTPTVLGELFSVSGEIQSDMQKWAALYAEAPMGLDLDSTFEKSDPIVLEGLPPGVWTVLSAGVDGGAVSQLVRVEPNGRTRLELPLSRWSRPEK